MGTVSGTGTMGGEQVVFVNDKYYHMSEIMAVGTLPKTEEAEAAEDRGWEGYLTPEQAGIVPEADEELQD